MSTRIVFLDRDTVAADFPQPSFAHEWRDFEATTTEQVVERLRGADAAITNKVPITAALLDEMPGLRFIAVAATGVDHVDLAACRERGVAVANVPAYSTQSVAEHTVMLMLALRRNLFAYRDALGSGEWARSERFALFDRPIHELAGTTLGIVGYGAIGRKVARMAEALGMRVLVSERKGETTLRSGRIAFEQVLREADVLSLHLPLAGGSENLLGPAEFAAMKPGALLINTARGALIDEQALVDAFTAGRIGGAGLDVFHTEPLPADHPLIGLQGPRLILTPHQAWASREAMATLAREVVANLEAWARGERRNRVD